MCNCCFDMEDTGPNSNPNPTKIPRQPPRDPLSKLPQEISYHVQKYLPKNKMSGVSYQNSMDNLARIHNQFYSYLQHHRKKYWAALVHSHGQLKQDDLVTDQFLSTVTQGPYLEKSYLIALARNHVHPVHIVAYLLSCSEVPEMPDMLKTHACTVAQTVCENDADFECTIPCMNSAAQEKIKLCAEYARENDTMLAFVRLCQDYVHMYQQRKVHHIEQGDNYTNIWCYNSNTVWSATSAFNPDQTRMNLPPAVLQQDMSLNRILSVQRYTKKLFYRPQTNKLMLKHIQPDGKVTTLDLVNANAKETVKAILTRNENVLVQLLRSGNINITDFNHDLLKWFSAIRGLETGPYVDIIIAGESGSIVHYFALSSKGKVYRVSLNRVSYSCNFVEIDMQSDVPVVQIVCVPQMGRRTPFYLVTRNAENTFCMCMFTDGSSVVVTHTQNVILIPKTIDLMELDTTRQDIDGAIVITAFTTAIVAIVPSHETGELKFCLIKQKFRRNTPLTQKKGFKITENPVSYLEPESEEHGFTINSIVEMVQLSNTSFFCLTANGNVYLCSINFATNTYIAYYVPLASLDTVTDGSGPVAASGARSAFRLRLRLSK